MGVIWTSRTRNRPPVQNAQPNKLSLARQATLLVAGGHTAVKKGLQTNTDMAYVARPQGFGARAASRAIGNGIAFSGASYVGTGDYTFVLFADLKSTTHGDGFSALLGIDNGVGSIWVSSDGNVASGAGGVGSLCFYEYQGGLGRIGAYADGMVNSGPAVYVMSMVGTTATIYRNGVNVTTGTTVVGSSISRATMPAYMHGLPSWVYQNIDSPVFMASIIDGVGASAVQAKTLALKPWTLFAAEHRPIMFGAGAGGNTYAATVAETATVGETMSATAFFGSTITETATASETAVSVVIFISSVSETGTASDSIAAALGAGTFAASISETATASETVSTLVSLQAAISETATASDSISSLVAFISAVSETVTASDSIAAQLANQTYEAAILETVTASDVIVATIPTTYEAAVIETISISDIAGATITNPSTFWTQISTTQMAGWGQIDNTQSSGWTIIPTN